MKLTDRVFHGVKWSTISQICRQGLQILTIVVLARILSPRDFGLVGMAMVVVGFASLFKTMGTSSAVIQRKSVSEGFLSSIFWVNVLFGLLTMALIFLTAPLIAGFYHEQNVAPLLRVLSFTFLVSGFSMLQNTILVRDLAFDKLAKIEITASLFGSLAGIGSALSGLGPWSLVYQTLTVHAVNAVLVWNASSWRPKVFCSWTEIKSVYSFSMNLTGYQVFYYFMRNADNLLIGKFLGAQQLGYYTLAYSLMLYPIRFIADVIGRVTLPVYAQLQDDHARFRRVFLRTGASIAMVSFPLMLGLIALSRPFVFAFFGPKWEPAIIVIRILALAGMLQSIESTVGAIYQAKARTDWLLRWGGVSGIIIIASFAVGLKWGIVGVSAAYVVASFALTYPSFAIPFKLIQLPVYDLVKSLRGPFIGSVIMFLSLVLLLTFMPQGTPPALTLGMLVPVGVVIYLASVWTTDRKDIRQILEMAGIRL